MRRSNKSFCAYTSFSVRPTSAATTKDHPRIVQAALHLSQATEQKHQIQTIPFLNFVSGLHNN